DMDSGIAGLGNLCLAWIGGSSYCCLQAPAGGSTEKPGGQVQGVRQETENHGNKPTVEDAEGGIQWNARSCKVRFNSWMSNWPSSSVCSNWMRGSARLPFGASPLCGA